MYKSLHILIKAGFSGNNIVIGGKALLLCAGQPLADIGADKRLMPVFSRFACYLKRSW